MARKAPIGNSSRKSSVPPGNLSSFESTRCRARTWPTTHVAYPSTHHVLKTGPSFRAFCNPKCWFVSISRSKGSRRPGGNRQSFLMARSHIRRWKASTGHRCCSERKQAKALSNKWGLRPSHQTALGATSKRRPPLGCVVAKSASACRFPARARKARLCPRA
jgi:hypothetical protein